MRTIKLENGKEIKISEESYKALQEGISEEILVPDNVKIEKNCGDGDGLGIVSYDGERHLNYYNKGFFYISSNTFDYAKCKLIPVKEEDRIVGHTYFRSDMIKPEFDSINRYCKYLGDNKYVYCETNGSVPIRGCSFDYWYKVIRVED